MTGNRRLRVAFGRTLLWLGVVVGAILASPTAAQAHAVLVSSSPAAGATVGAAPDAVVLEFDEPLVPSLSHATVVDPTGRRFNATVAGERMRVPLGVTVPGVYHVTWTTVSEVDGHTISGELQFGVGVVVSSDAAGRVQGAGTGDVVVAVLRGVEYTILILACGLVTLRRLAAGQVPVRDGARTVAVALLASAVAVVAAEANLATERPSVGAILDYLAIGGTGIARLVGLLCAAGLVGVAMQRRRLSPYLVGAVVIALAAAGHAANVDPPWLGIAVNALHVAASGVWAGGIVALAMQRLTGDWTAAGTKLMASFARVAPWAFATSIAMGLVQATQLVGYWNGLIETAYGRILIVKIAAVVAMIGLSLMALRRRPMVRAEALVAVAVVLAAGLLTSAPVVPSEAREAAEKSRTSQPGPQAAVAFPRAGDLTMGGRAGDSLVALTVRPGRPGSNQVYAYVASTPAVTAAVSASIGGTTREFTACGSSCWSTTVDLVGGEQIHIRVPGPHGGTVGFALPSLPAPDASARVTSASAWMNTLRSYQVDEMFSGIHSKYAFAVPHQMWLRMWLSGTPRDSLWLGTSLYKRSSPTAPWSAPVSAQPVPVPYVAWKPFGPAANPTLIGVDTLDGVPVRKVSFFGGHGTDPEPVWFTLWLDNSGRVLRSQMWAPNHFMDDRYSGFNQPVNMPRPPGA
jgi:copper transport protein